MSKIASSDGLVDGEAHDTRSTAQSLPREPCIMLPVRVTEMLSRQKHVE
jgi:hypothetical protein